MPQDGTQTVLDLGTITVHCFACPHRVERSSPAEAHDAMEEHYAAAHADLIARLVRGL